MDPNPQVCHSLTLGPGLYIQPRYRSRCILWTSVPNTATVTSYLTALMYYALIFERAHIYPYFQSKYNRRKGLDFEKNKTTQEYSMFFNSYQWDPQDTSASFSVQHCQRFVILKTQVKCVFFSSTLSEVCDPQDTS